LLFSAFSVIDFDACARVPKTLDELASTRLNDSLSDIVGWVVYKLRGWDHVDQKWRTPRAGA
jgi:hypothetical protein